MTTPLPDGLVANMLSKTVSDAVNMLQEQGLREEKTLRALLTQASEVVHSDPGLSEHLSRVCVDAAAEAALIGVRGSALYLVARVNAERGELQRASMLINEARQNLKEAGATIEAMRTGLGQIHVLDDLGDHGQALEVAQDLLKRAEELHGNADPDPEIKMITADATRNMGTTYGLLGQHEKALAAFAVAEVEYEALGERWEMASSMANRGIELIDLGRPREALGVLETAGEIFIEADDALFAAQCDGERARALRAIGEMTQALTLLERARISLASLGAHAEATRLHLVLAQTYLAVGLQQQGLQAASEAGDAFEEFGMLHDLGVARYLAGSALLSLNDPEAAITELNRAAALSAEVKDPQHQALIRLVLAEARMSSVSPETTRAELNASLNELSAGGWVIPQTHAHLLLADLAEDNASLEDHLFAAEGLSVSLSLPELTYQLELRWGRLRHSQLHIDRAECHYRAAIETLSRASSALTDHVLLTSFRAERMAAYSELVDLLLERNNAGDVVKAAAFSDASRSRTLIDLIAGEAHTGPDLGGEEPALTEAYEELTDTYARLEAAEGSGAKHQVRERISVLQDRVGALRLRGAKQLHEPRNQEVRSGFRPDGEFEACGGPVIAYFVIESDVVAFVRVGGAISARRMRGALPRIHAELDALEEQWSRFAVSLTLGLRQHESLLRSAESTLATLYDLLISPIEDLIDAKVDALHIVPHGPLGAVPFHALFDGRAHLTQRWAITLSPTMSTIAEEIKVDCRAAALVVAVPDENAPAVSREAQLVSAYLPAASVLLGHEATAERFAASVAGCALVHVACHGLHSDGSPLFARLRLGDRWITSLEIVRLDLRGSLVALSSCVSGKRGLDVEAVGLAWAFLGAGARGVTASMWQVHDEAATVLMDEYYRHLSLRLGPAAALQQAQIATAAQFPHPFSWAPFAYVNGSLDPLYQSATPLE